MIPFNGVFLRILDIIKTSCQPKTLQINTNYQSYSVSETPSIQQILRFEIS